MKRIAHYAPNLWAKGGIATYVSRLGEAQETAGCEVLYFSRTAGSADPENTVVVRDDRELFEKTKALNCDVLHLHKPVHYLPADRVTTVRTMHGNQGSCPTGTRFLVRSVEPCKRKYSVPGCLASHLMERCGSIKPARVKQNFSGIKNELRLGARLHTFTVSHFLKSWMMRTGYAEDLLHVIRSPAPETNGEFESPTKTDKPRFAYIGRLVPEKGARWLLRALKQVRADVAVDIAGDGPLKAELEAYCEQNGMADRVTFHGWLPQPDISALIKNARAVVFPSIWEEPAGLITLEAAALGRAVIASRVGGIPEYALDDFSLLVAPNNAGQLAGAIERLARDHELAVRMGECALRNARERYAFDGFIARQFALYRLALEVPDKELSEIDRN